MRKLALALILLAVPAQAVQVFLNDVAGWEAALPGPYGRADFDVPNVCPSEVVTDGDFTAVEANADDHGPHACIRDGKLFGSTWSGDPTTMTFGAPVWGVLFDVASLEDGDIYLSGEPGDWQVDYYDDDIRIAQFGVVFDAPVDVLYFGTGDHFALESIRWKPVPEPGSAALLALGLALLAKRR